MIPVSRVPSQFKNNNNVFNERNAVLLGMKLNNLFEFADLPHFVVLNRRKILAQKGGPRLVDAPCSHLSQNNTLKILKDMDIETAVAITEFMIKR